MEVPGLHCAIWITLAVYIIGMLPRGFLVTRGICVGCVLVMLALLSR